jgi:hypothetical protein
MTEAIFREQFLVPPIPTVSLPHESSLFCNGATALNFYAERSFSIVSHYLVVSFLRWLGRLVFVYPTYLELRAGIIAFLLFIVPRHIAEDFRRRS